jgi:seryl-tRNA(Sec) selenium transferase
VAKIPHRLEDLLPFGVYEKVVDMLHNPDLSGRVRDALQKVGINRTNPLEQVQDAWQQAKTWLGSLTQHTDNTAAHRINATGQLWVDEIIRAPMIPSVGLAWARANSTFTDRQQYLNRSVEILERAVGRRQHLWLTSVVLSLQLATRTLGQRALIARCDCVRVPGVGDVRAMLAAFGSNVHEVGATNFVGMQDWHDALSQQKNAVVIIVSPSMLPKAQWAQHRLDALQAARQHGCPVVELLLDGCFNRSLTLALGFPHPFDRLQDSADLLLIPANLLLGGASGVLCLGSEGSIQTLVQAARPVAAELEIPAIAANLMAIQLAGLAGDVDLGVLGALSANPENLRNRCNRLAIQLNGVGDIISAQVIDSQHSLGPSPWDQYQLSNSVVALQGKDPTGIQERLKRGLAEQPGIDTKRRGEEVLIDLRFVPPEDDHLIASIYQ